MPTLQQISWKQIAEQILQDLDKIKQHCGKPMAAIYADNLLRTMTAMRDRFPFEPCTEVVMALHDAIAFQNRWIDYDAGQYWGARDLLETLVASEQISNDEVEEAILTLEKLGFDTLPFEILDASIALDNPEN